MKTILFIMPFKEKMVFNTNEKCEVEYDFDKSYNEMKKFLEENYSQKIIVERVDTLIQNDIQEKMYKSIHSADIVIADVTDIKNANVFYELGARHALRDKTTIVVSDFVNEKEIPFDILPYTIYAKGNVFKNFDTFLKIIKNDKIDSPVRKHITINEHEKDKSIFDSYNSTYDEFISGLEKIEKGDYQKRLIYIEQWKNFKNFEWYDQLLSLNKYKLAELEYSISEKDNKSINEFFNKLEESLDILKKHNINESKNQETLGLICSIYRKMYELKGDSIKPLAKLAREYAYKFINLFPNASYSHSSVILINIAKLEKGRFKKQTVIDNLRSYFDYYQNIDYEKTEKEYFDYTNDLYEIIFANSFEEEVFQELKDKYKETNTKDHSYTTSKICYERVLKAMEEGVM